jgi:hypothetical protein
MSLNAAMEHTVLRGSESSTETNTSPANRYVPTETGYRIRIAAQSGGGQEKATPELGVVQDNARVHRRPLYLRSERALVWNAEELKRIERRSFRPLVVAHNEPRFLFDYHAAGGLLGHLYLGLVANSGKSKWFHQWEEIEAEYIEGRMEYRLQDAEFPGVVVQLGATPLAKSVGLAVKVRLEGLKGEAKLVWSYGGASGSAYSRATDESYRPEHCAKNLVQWRQRRLVLLRAFDKSDSFATLSDYSVIPFLPDWRVMIQGGSTWKTEVGFGAPESFLA